MKKSYKTLQNILFYFTETFDLLVFQQVRKHINDGQKI